MGGLGAMQSLHIKQRVTAPQPAVAQQMEECLTIPHIQTVLTRVLELDLLTFPILATVILAAPSILTHLTRTVYHHTLTISNTEEWRFELVVSSKYLFILITVNE